MASRRTKSIGTKVTPEEYDRIHSLAGEQPISEWVRAALLTAAADPPAADSIMLAEMPALRTILLNLHFDLSSGTPVTAEAGGSSTSPLARRYRSRSRQRTRTRPGCPST
jgi:hypothetical protein